ncbi:MAG: DUF5615 family PIN-like protein [Candidatus Omnitrophica bacterium]|nr:DUF5615 family PIN-like protein [Candidatus Omnitrophota bacterium]MCA9428032.1 DUF5615 family PIN-like protein [Candidatus Omnitrophota bacterium]MCA9433676.1 DUF5615 family PIN-like protein [Candidatus Omnitrophota bacterium]MCA9441632.1 DUF5615 family PIN-like protein [Candidatus Omnitrophota bacterium]MCA9450107.1 DUF5615 family PIN-like protein [Candidatus Omnitrophota bacterium]
MKLKLDENLGHRVRRLFTEAGHDVHTVFDEDLSGAPDEEIFEACVREERTLITLDHDFGNILRFAYQDSPGIAILEKPEATDYSALLALCQQVSDHLETGSIHNCLWIASPKKIRIRYPE